MATRSNPFGSRAYPVNFRNGDSVVGKGPLKVRPCGVSISGSYAVVVKGADGAEATISGPGTFPGQFSEVVSSTAPSVNLLFYFD